MPAKETASLQREVETLRAQIAESEKRRRDLEESEALYRVLAERSLVGVYLLQGDKMAYVNETAADMLGLRPHELIGRETLEIVAPESQATFLENIARRMHGEIASVRYPVVLLHMSGQRVEAEVYGTVAMYHGKPAIIGTIVDRTEERRAERALRSSEARFQAFMDHTPALAFMKDAEGRVAYGNRALHEMLQLSPGSLVGRTTEAIFPADTARRMIELDHQVLTTRSKVESTVSLPTPAGPRDLLQVKFPVVDPSGQWLVGGVAIDITERCRAENALAEQGRILRSILESMADGVAVINEKGETILLNQAAQNILGVEPEGLEAEGFVTRYRSFAADGSGPLSAEQLPLVRAIRGESTDAVEFLVHGSHKPEGIWLRVTGRPLVGEDGEVRGGVTVFHDTTEEHKTLEDLRLAEAKLRAHVEQMPVVSYTTSGVDGRVLYVSPQIETKLGFPAEDWLGVEGLWERQLHPEDRDRAVAEFAKLVECGNHGVVEYRMIARDGSVVWFRDEVVRICPTDGRAAYFQGVLLDITERELERGKRERLQELSMDLVAVQEAERRRIGLELHDEVGQLLTGLKLRLGTAAGLPREDLERRLLEVDHLVDEATERVRELSQSLRPSVLDDLGLLPALVSYFGRYSRQTGVRVEFEHRGVERRRFAPDVETAAYRIVQEALTNVARHAHVAAVRVRAWADADHFGVKIEDDGPGFDPGATRGHGRTSGLTGMRERAALLNGQLTVDSGPGRGCRVTCELPTETR